VVQQHSSSFLPNGKLMTVLSFVTFQWILIIIRQILEILLF
jgi:hypothetical protein